MTSLHSTVAILAIVGTAVAALALLLCLVLALKLRRIRAAQKTVLGDGTHDLVGHAAELQRQFQALYDYVQDAANQLNGRLQVGEDRLDGTLAYRALVRYDAYGEMSGQQSTSIALLDAHRSGLVLSSIHHRDQARLYAKQITQGEPEYELSPEENEAIRLALGAERPDQARA
ncbi:MAG: DUF4446 family protein [Solirubrobacteraceae bacterium]